MPGSSTCPCHLACTGPFGDASPLFSQPSDFVLGQENFYHMLECCYIKANPQLVFDGVFPCLHLSTPSDSHLLFTEP
ncbi:unnamed protein product [Leuciscus chuanchicus]